MTRAVGDRPTGGEHAAYGALVGDAERVLSRWRGGDDEQEVCRLGMLAHVRTHGAAALARDGAPEHLTVGCLVFSADLGSVLLTHHRKAGRWFQLGGHVEPGDAGLREVALREALEEGGIEGLEVTPAPVHLHRHRLPAAFGRCREHLDVRYAARAPAGARPVVSAESLDVRWWPVGALPEGSRDDLAPLVRWGGHALTG